MKKLFQKSWHGIFFNEFTTVNEMEVANSRFYYKFYDYFFRKYSSFDDIPADYIVKKKPVIDYLLKKCQSKQNILSIGCGVGLIEKLLIEKTEMQSKIAVIEPSENAVKWILQDSRINIYNGYFPDIIENRSLNFDYGYARAVEYVFNEVQYIEFLENVVNFEIKEFSIISVCLHRRSPKELFKEAAKSILSRLKLYDRGQFWGYLRTEHDHKRAFYAAGFKNIKVDYVDKSTIVITGTV
jgi:hypothetical protein